MSSADENSRENAIEQNTRQVKEMQRKYPNKIKMMRMDVFGSSLNQDKMHTATSQEFDNADPVMSEFILKQLELGKEVALFASGKYRIMVKANENLFRR